MTENPLPSPQTSSPQGAETTPPAGAITPSANGAPPAGKPPAGSTLKQLATYYAINAGLLAGLWLIAFAVLWLYGLRRGDALGFATVVAVVGSFFTRSLVPQLSEKARPAPSATPHHVDSAREIIETVVFVVVLVLLLKSYAAEAFVIPTGSMAETLWGYQKVVNCPQCGLEFPVNCSQEVDPSDGSEPVAVRGCTCPNCRLDITLWRPTPNDPGPMPAREGFVRDPGWRSGDRVLVAKFVYDLLNRQPERLDVVVFKFPGENNFPLSGPVKKHVPINYIKRLIGLPGETIAIHRGKLWVLSPSDSPKYDDYEKARGDPGALAMLWRREFTHHDDPRAVELFTQDRENRYAIVRKKPENLLAMRRIVYDNDHQALDLQKKEEDARLYRRWVAADNSGWEESGKTAFKHPGGQSGTAWLRYRHVLRNSNGSPQLITDFMGYNTWMGGAHQAPRENWASDLMVECEVQVEKPDGSLVLELSRGEHRYQASFDLATGVCKLTDLITHGPDKGKEAELGSAPTTLKGKGKRLVRFANVDERLVVWVDDRLPFGDGVNYEPVRGLAPTRENDLERPVSVGTKGVAVTVSKLKVYRDTYYTTARNDSPAMADVDTFKPDDPTTFDSYAKAPVSTYYVQPGHYLCLGDNSPESSDGRSWGLVPQRLLLGRALLVYYPFSRAGRIR
jgi:signal peptidase I